MFALVVSLAHVHNIAAPTAASTTAAAGNARVGGVGAEQSSSQLHVQLSSGGQEAIVTARRK